MNAQAAIALDREVVRAPLPGLSTEKTGKAFEVTVNRQHRSLWCCRKPEASPSVTLAQLKEARLIDEKIASSDYGSLRYKIVSSAQAGVFSLGGDLGFFARCIESNDRAALAEYAALAVRAVWANVSAFGNRRVRTIAVVQGEAQGGGFEAALSCNTLVAERGSNFGFPEPLFGMFPGMGGELLLSSRIDHDVAQRMVQSTNRYTAEFLHEIGVVDYLVERGEGVVYAEQLLERVESMPGGDEGQKMRSRQDNLDKLEFSALFESVERWTEQAFRLTPRNLRSMRYILEAQSRRAR